MRLLFVHDQTGHPLSQVGRRSDRNRHPAPITELLCSLALAFGGLRGPGGRALAPACPACPVSRSSGRVQQEPGRLLAATVRARVWSPSVDVARGGDGTSLDSGNAEEERAACVACRAQTDANNPPNPPRAATTAAPPRLNLNNSGGPCNVSVSCRTHNSRHFYHTRTDFATTKQVPVVSPHRAGGAVATRLGRVRMRASHSASAGRPTRH